MFMVPCTELYFTDYNSTILNCIQKLTKDSIPTEVPFPKQWIPQKLYTICLIWQLVVIILVILALICLLNRQVFFLVQNDFHFSGWITACTSLGFCWSVHLLLHQPQLVKTWWCMHGITWLYNVWNACVCQNRLSE